MFKVFVLGQTHLVEARNRFEAVVSVLASINRTYRDTSFRVEEVVA